MIAPKPNLLCEQAKLYYGFLCDESRELIPESIVNHMEQCQNCQEQISHFKSALSQAEAHEDSGQEQVSSAVTTMLKLHFAYVDKPVTCNTTKSFLPGLLDPSLKIPIPTPITAHLNNCQKCREDLDIIRGLYLNRKQLCRLSQLFAEEPGEDNVSCSQAKAAIIAVVFMALHKTNEGVLKHLCTCPDCRKMLYQYRESFRKDLLDSKEEQKESICEEVSATDIFDYTVPYGLDPADDQYAKFRESLTSHLCSCPTCLAKIQQLHDTVYGIAERAESEVVTIYNIDKSAKAQAIGEPDDLYAGFPIRVEIASHEDNVDVEQPVPTIDFTTALKRKVSAMNLKPLLKAGIVAAAVILIGLALLLNTPTAKAVTIEQIYKAIEKVKNVYISSFVPNKPEPTQEIWVSRTLNIYMTKTEKELVLWDIPNGTRKIKRVDTAVTETTPLSDDSVASIEGKMSGSLGLLPFYDISEIPPGAEWRHVDDQILEVAEGIEIYDLKWTERKYGGSAELKKWRVFADAKTSLPQRVEWYTRVADDAEFVLETVMVVEYLDESEIQAVIKEVFF